MLDSDAEADMDARSLDAQASELLGEFEEESARDDHLVRLTAADKTHQHDADRIPELDQLLAQDDEVKETERKAREMQQELDVGAHGKVG